MFDFNSDGFLMPVGKITTDLQDVETSFVKKFPNSNTRLSLWTNYLSFLERFKKKVTNNFVQWINGSFVTKKENPNDMDLVTFVDYRIFEPMETAQYLEEFWSYNLESQGLDSYLLAVYPENHQDYPDYQMLLNKWAIRYTNAKQNVVILNNVKGFLELKFNV